MTNEIALKLQSQLENLEKRLHCLEQMHKGGRPAMETLPVQSILAFPEPPIIENLRILGFQDLPIFISGTGSVNEPLLLDIIIPIPPGTSRVLAFLKGWAIGYGTAKETVMENALPSIHLESDQHFLFAEINVDVESVGTTEAVLRARALLRDNDGAENFTAALSVGVIFLAHG